MYQDHSALQVAGQLLIAFLFLVSGVRNIGWKARQHLDRMVAYGVPEAKIALIVGFLMQFSGAILVALDYRRALGAGILIAFTLLASAIFHRWWLADDPLVRHLLVSALLVNCGVVGGLLLVMAI
jgi:putative oxidoreductase